eukprot:1478477-Amphidinium_carterae.1
MLYLRDAHLVTAWQSSGLSRLSSRIVKYAVVVGIAAYVPETLVATLLEDARLLKEVHATLESVLDEVTYIQSLSAATWKWLGKLCQCPALE